MTEPKPCPFCPDGGIASLCYGTNAHGKSIFGVECCRCGASSNWYYSEEDAIEAWNTRAADNATQHTHCCPCGAERTCNIESCEEFDERGIWAIELSCGHADIYSSMKPGHCSCCGAKVVE